MRALCVRFELENRPHGIKSLKAHNFIQIIIVIAIQVEWMGTPTANTNVKLFDFNIALLSTDQLLSLQATFNVYIVSYWL